MRSALFSFAAFLGSRLVDSIRELCDFSLLIVSRLNAAILKLIDEDKFTHIQSAYQQMDEINELNVLSNIFEVRNEAVQAGEWNDEHEGKLNFLANLLYNEYDWDEEEVQRYIHEVILTGPKVEFED